MNQKIIDTLYYFVNAKNKNYNITEIQTIPPTLSSVVIIKLSDSNYTNLIDGTSLCWTNLLIYPNNQEYSGLNSKWSNSTIIINNLDGSSLSAENLHVKKKSSAISIINDQEVLIWNVTSGLGKFKNAKKLYMELFNTHDPNFFTRKITVLR